MTASVHLDGRVSGQTDTSLALSYSVVNDGDEPVLVCNRLYGGQTDAGLYVLDQNVAYVLFESGSTPNVTKRILERGEGVNIEHPIQPCATALAPGERFEEMIVLALPLAPANPYRMVPARDPSLATPSDGLTMSIGWVARADLDDELMPEVDTSDGRLPIVKASWLVQQLAVVELGVSVPVLAPGPSFAVQRVCSACGAVNMGEQQGCLRCGTPLPVPVTPVGPDWQPTHRVWAAGAQAYDAPGGTPTSVLDAGLAVRVLEQSGEWARVVGWTGWTGWVYVRALEPIG